MYFISLSLLWLSCFLLLSPLLNNKNLKRNFSLAIVLIICSSLLITYMIKIFFYFNHINLEKNLFLSIYIFLSIILFFNNRKNYNLKIDLTKYGFILIILFLLTSLIVILDNSVSFTHWDSVVSWNRWANELSKFEFNPASALYPILWPSIWSLIYELQLTSEYEFVAKSSLLIILVIFFFSIYFYSINVGYLPGLIFVILLLINYNHTIEFLVSGYMDQPVSLLLLSALILFSTLPYLVKKKYDLVLISSATVISLSILTKQPALIIALFYFIFLFIQLLKKKINLNYFFSLNLILFVPYILFLIFYLKTTGTETTYLSSLYKFNFLHYSEISIRGAILQSSFLMNGVSRILNEGGIFFLIILIFPIFFSYLIKNKELKIINYSLIGITLIGFIIYAKCCSYEIRNGYWLLGISICTSANIFTRFVDKLTLGFLSKSLFSFRPFKTIMIINVIFFFMIFIPELKTGFIINKHAIEKKKLGGEENAKLLKKDLDTLNGCFKVYAAHQLIKYNYHLKEYKELIVRTSFYSLKKNFFKNYKIDKCYIYFVFYDEIHNIENNKKILRTIVERGGVRINKNIYKLPPNFIW